MPAHDLALWDISLIDRSLLCAASYTEMFTPVLLKSGAGSGYGLGVFLEKREGHAVIEHSGEVSGFVSENLVFPDDREAIVVLTNEMASPAASLIGRRLTPIVLGTGAPAPARSRPRRSPSSTGWPMDTWTAASSPSIATHISASRRSTISPPASSPWVRRSASKRPSRKRAAE
jgi:CubicO group peptidase (beta-lactamase class C family)